MFQHLPHFRLSVDLGEPKPIAAWQVPRAGVVSRAAVKSCRFLGSNAGVHLIHARTVWVATCFLGAILKEH